MTDNPTPLFSRPLVRMGLIAAGAALATVLVMALYASISSRKAEAKQTSFKLVDLDEKTVDPAQWGKNFPRQYDAYLKTAEKYSTKYGGAGSEALPKSRIQEDPRLVTIFDGYAFAIDFNLRRGHAYMLDDQRNTKRVTERKQPGSCLHCHASNTVAFRELGLQGGAPGTLDEAFTAPNAQAQLMAGFEAMCKLPYGEATKLVKHPVACIDCHDPKNMALRVTKPGFIRGIVALANSTEPVPHLPSIEKWRKGDKSVAYDANRDASRQELRSMVCGQCHVEYYCGPKVTLFFPWNKGLKVEQIEATYDEYKFPDGHRFFDWQHGKTGAEVLKAQHPEFEMWSQGIHARSGVSCADCHMPYVREGALKISDHQVRSPLLNVSRSCQTCHRFPEEEIKARVTAIQDRTKALMDRAEDAVVNLINDIAAAKKAGVDEAKLKPIYELQRKAQWRVDFVNAENSMGFHAPQEAARILGEAIDYGRQGQVALRDLGAPKMAKK
ncbi:ammonia-forming cytochrome c nitrite reductase subunit c552 [Geothrix fermentans]|uniref:ammonia-forming cytochrome c nitrite reductase subunit c552 n=1 Tax=Geothrix fermentans TaxID=44676 RepID=UPI00041DA1B8|nr:ammonia-forming cytochrome c nitrite reductase subunit c552 [Geothrix fermentans]